MRGLLIFNHFLMTSQFTTLYDRLSAASRSLGIDLELCSNVEAVSRFSSGGRFRGAFDFALFWDKDIRLCQLIEGSGIRSFNSSEAIAVCDDKSALYTALCGRADIPLPSTVVVPKVYSPVNWQDTDFPDEAIRLLGLPLVAKESFGSFGQQVHLMESGDELVAFLNRAGTTPAILQEFVSSSRGTDARLQVVGGRLVAAMRRRSLSDDFRSNVVNGGTAEVYDPSDAEAALAVRACSELGLDFAGIDLLFGEDGPLLCEVNSNAHFATLERCSGVDIALEIMQHIASTMEDENE